MPAYFILELDTYVPPAVLIPPVSISVSLSEAVSASPGLTKRPLTGLKHLDDLSPDILPDPTRFMKRR
jgi:hypothetical protein